MIDTRQQRQVKLLQGQIVKSPRHTVQLQRWQHNFGCCPAAQQDTSVAAQSGFLTIYTTYQLLTALFRHCWLLLATTLGLAQAQPRLEWTQPALAAAGRYLAF